MADLPATILELAGQELPEDLDGESLRSLLDGGSRARGPIFWEHEGGQAVRRGDLKAVRPFRGQWELYDLAADRSELHDLAARRPDDLAELVAAWDAWALEVGVKQWPWVLPIYRQAAAGVALIALAFLIAMAWAIRRALRAARLESAVPPAG